MKKIVRFLMLMMIVSSVSIVSAETNHKLNFLFLGTDSGILQGRSESLIASRSDAVMIVTLDENEHKMTLSTIPRDGLINVPGYGNDKLTHAFAYGGPELTKKTLEEWLGIKFDRYVATNMTGFVKLMEVFETVKVVPPTTFSYGTGNDFIEGQSQEINPEQALAYARERKTSGGDYARQARMRQMVKSIIERLIDEGSIEGYRQAFENRYEYIETDFTFDELTKLFEEYGNRELVIEEYQFEGNSQRDPSAGYVEVIEDASLQGLIEIVQ